MTDQAAHGASRRTMLGMDLPGNRMERLVELAHRAPSTHNSQPWKFAINGRSIDLFADLTRWLAAADADQRELYMSLGCALETLLIAADYEALGVDIAWFPSPSDDTHVCRVTVDEQSPRRRDAAPTLLHALPRRHTSRLAFERDHPIAARELAHLRAAADGENAAIDFVPAGPERAVLPRLLEEIERELYADHDFRADMGRWVSSGAMGQGWLQAKFAQFKVAHAGAAQLAHTDAELLESAPEIAILSTAHNRRIDEVMAGQAYARAALIAEHYNLRIQPFSAFTANSNGRATLRQAVRLGNRHPQLVFRIGHGAAATTRAPRRPLKDILLKTD